MTTIFIETRETHMNQRTSAAHHTIHRRAASATAAILAHLVAIPLAGATFTPTIIPLSADELMNPMRGYYAKGRSEMIPQPEPPYDYYARFSWRDLEPTRDTYNFAPIDTEINYALSRGGNGARFHFRVRCMTSATSGLILVPDYLRNLMEKGWYHTNNTYIPDWNDSDFISRAQALMNALGTRYNNDPRIGYVDIGFYGLYGEWHMYQVPYPSPTGATLPTTATKRALVDLHRMAFPNKYVLMLTDDLEALTYAMSVSTTIGVRVDSLGNSCCMNTSILAPALERWKIAPFVTEFFGPGNTTPSIALSQVQQYHVSAVSNGNIDAWNTWSTADQQTLLEVGKRAGYRYEMQELTIPSPLTAGQSAAVTSRWRNAGVAPIYEPFNVMLQLRTTQSTAPVFQQQLSVPLRTLLPSTATTSYSDTITVPANLTPGTYTVAVAVLDPSGYRRPLKLAIQGRQSDGSYSLGTITVTASSGPVNIPPRIWISSPLPGAVFTAPAAITIHATAYDEDDAVARVEFYAGTTLLATDTASPYTATWTDVPVGNYTLSARAYDTRAAVAVSTTVACTVLPEPAGSSPRLLADTYVNSAASTTNYGNDPQLRTKTGSTTRLGYLLFDLSAVSGTVRQATLRLYGSINGSTPGIPVAVHPVTDTTWRELTMTWMTRPAYGTAVATTTVLDATPRWYSWDVTSYVADELAARRTAVSFCLRNVVETAEYIIFNTKEAPDNQPVLVVSTGDAPGQTPPRAPEQLTLVGATTDTVTLSWVDTADNETGFHLERKIGSAGTFIVAATVPANSAVYTDVGLTPGTTYVYRIRAFNGAGASAYSTECMGVTAALPPRRFPLITAVIPAVGGIITPSSGTYTEGTVVTVLAQPASGYFFVQWQGDIVGAQNPASVTMNSTRTVIALFEPVPVSSDTRYCTVTVTVDPPNGGIVMLTPAGGYYPVGTTVTVTAVPANGFVFAGWEGPLTPPDNPFTFVVTDSVTITATFQRVPHINQPPTVGITHPQTGTTFTRPVSITVQAVAEDPDGSVVKVDFYVNGSLVGEDAAAPYTMVWFDVPAGSYQITAAAWDDSGAVGYASPITVMVTDASSNPPADDMPAAPTPGTVIVAGGMNGYIDTRQPDARLSVRFTPPKHGTVTVRIYDLIGRVVSTRSHAATAMEPVTLTWNVDTMPAGIYLLHLEGGGMGVRKHFVVVR
jgi:hypothetical protein